MGSKLYVGGLPYAATESQLTTLFAAHGTVESARVITDKFTGQSRGFGFVEMATQEEAKAAIAALNGSQMDGRPLTVNEAKPQEPRTGGGSGGVRWRQQRSMAFDGVGDGLRREPASTMRGQEGGATR